MALQQRRKRGGPERYGDDIGQGGHGELIDGRSTARDAALNQLILQYQRFEADDVAGQAEVENLPAAIGKNLVPHGPAVAQNIGAFDEVIGIKQPPPSRKCYTRRRAKLPEPGRLDLAPTPTGPPDRQTDVSGKGVASRVN